MRATFGTAGKTELVGTSREWAGGVDTFSAHLSATPRGGRTRVRLQVRLDGSLAVTWILTFLVSFLSTMFLAVSKIPVDFKLASIFVVLSAIYLLARTISRNIHRNGVARANEFLGRLEKLVPAAEATTASSVQPVEQPMYEHL